MDVVLDTNIFGHDFPLKSKDFDILMHYLDKTESSIIIPEIVIDEIVGLYKRTLIECQSKFNSANSNLKHKLPWKNEFDTNLNIDIEKETLLNEALNTDILTKEMANVLKDLFNKNNLYDIYYIEYDYKYNEFDEHYELTFGDEMKSIFIESNFYKFYDFLYNNDLLNYFYPKVYTKPPTKPKL